MYFKKILCAFLSAAMAITFVGCADKGVGENSSALGEEVDNMNNNDTFTFTVFSDSHYYNDIPYSFYAAMTPTSVDDLKAVMDRAVKADSDFVIHAGDFCNGYAKSPEWTDFYINNKALGDKNLPVYGVYGNHELEDGDTMAVVTPLMTNQADSVGWGTEDGKIGDGSIAYYYFDRGDYRFVCTDTNYNFKDGVYSRAEPWSYGNGGYLGEKQLAWLDKILIDAAEKSLHCIVFSHETFCPNWHDISADTEKVQSIFKKVNAIKKSTVIMAINGHYHTARYEVLDGILYYSVLALRVGTWIDRDGPYYDENENFKRKVYDDDGNYITTVTTNVGLLSMAKYENFYKDALSIDVELSKNGRIKINGMSTEWLYKGPTEADLDLYPQDKPFVTTTAPSVEFDKLF